MKNTRRNIVVGLLTIIGGLSAQLVGASPTQLPQRYLPTLVPATPSHQVVSFTPRYNYRPFRNRLPVFYRLPPRGAAEYGYARPHYPRQMPTPMHQQRFHFRPMRVNDQRYASARYPRGYPMPVQLGRGAYPNPAFATNVPVTMQPPAAPWNRQFAMSYDYRPATTYRYRPLEGRGRYAPVAFTPPTVRYPSGYLQSRGFVKNFRPVPLQPPMERNRYFSDSQFQRYAAHRNSTTLRPPTVSRAPGNAYRPVVRPVAGILPRPSNGPERALRSAAVTGLGTTHLRKNLKRLPWVAPVVGQLGPRSAFRPDYRFRQTSNVNRRTISFRPVQVSRPAGQNSTRQAAQQASRYKFRPDASLSGREHQSWMPRPPVDESHGNAHPQNASNIGTPHIRGADVTIWPLAAENPLLYGRGEMAFPLLADNKVHP
jgi:hypothetical protein